MRRIIILWHIILMPLLGYSQICGVYDTTLVARGATVNVPIEILPADLLNDDLSDPAQGLCGVEIGFEHFYATELGITLTSPDGQSVQLTGPTTISVLPPITVGANWQVTFVPSSETAMPDVGLTSNWDNNLNAGIFLAGGQYRGSYYPYNGNLEDFNTGSVSGTWTVELDNSQSLSIGRLLYVRLIFCDQTGLDCCFADAGRLDDPDLDVCIGDAVLDFIPDSQPNGTTPDPNIYGFTYVVSRDSVLEFYDSTSVDLTAMPAGTYQVCGLSYLRADSLLLPQPDGSYTLGEMFSDLNSLSPSFCADLTGDCQQIIINEPPIPVDLPAQICEGETYTYLDSTFSQSGTYPYTLQTAAGCDSIVNIILDVIPTLTTNLDTTICDGEMVMIGSSTYNTMGLYRDTLLSAIGCDSVIVLDLEVVPDVVTNLDTVICRGDSLVIDGQAYFDTESFQVILPSSLSCDSIVNVNLQVLDPQIDIAPVDTITCAQPTVILDAGASTPAGLVTFEWQDLAGNTLGTESTLAVDEPGEYVLFLTQELLGQQCTVMDTVEVANNESFPVADAGTDQLLSCEQTTVTLGGPGTSAGNEFTYEWTTDTGNFLDAQDLPAPRIDAAGLYTLIVTNNNNSCQDTAMVTITAEQELPTIMTIPDTSITCSNRSVLLTSEGSSTGVNFAYEWRDSQNTVVGNSADLQVDAGGVYRLIIRNTLSGCTDSSSVNVQVDTLAPVLVLDDVQAITCETNSLRLNATASVLDPDVSINWATFDGGTIEADESSLTPLVNAAGTYRLTLNNTRNACATTASVSVEDIRNTQTAAPLTPDIISCGLSSVSLDAGTSSTGPHVIYQWSTADGQFVGPSTGQRVDVNAPGTYTLTVLDTLSRCSDVATLEVQRDVNAPVAEAGPGFAIDCALSQDTLWGTGSSVGANIIYSWSGPCLESNLDSIWVIASCPGMYYLEVTDLANSCSVTDSVEVRMDEDTPVAAVLPVDTLSCTLSEVVLNANPSTPANELEFNWTGPGLTGTLSTPSVSVDVAGDYQLVVINTINNCTDTLSVNVAENTVLPQVAAGPDIILSCDMPVDTIGSDVTSTGPVYTYLWVEVVGQLPAAKDQPSVPVDQEGIFRLIVTDTRNGCRDSSQVNVIENKEFPGANAGSDQELSCRTDVVDLDGSSSVQGPDIVYQWTGPCLLGRTDSIGARADCPGEYFLQVTNTSTGCSTLDTVVISLNLAAPSAVLPDTAEIDCTTGLASLDGSASSAGTYRWFKDGLTFTSGLNRINVEETGLYVLSVETLDGSCTDQDSILVVGNCRPEAVILPPEMIRCENPTVIIDASGSQGQSLSYEWIPPDPSCVISGQGSPNLEVSCGGDYTLILTNDQVMMSDTQTVTVPMDDNMPIAVVGPPDTLNCVKNEVILDGSASSTGPNIIYRWTRVSNGALIAETATAVTQQPGTFVLEVLDTVSQCRSSASVRIVEFKLPISLSFGDSVLACGQDTFALTAFPTPLSDFYTFDWDGPEILEPSTSATVLVGAVGTYTVTVTDQRSECEATASLELTETQQCAPCVTIATPDTLTCADPSLQLEAEFCRSCTGCVLQWTSGDGNIVSGGNTLQPIVDQVGTYRLTVIDLQGFQTEVEVAVVADNTIPIADAGPDRNLTCDSTAVTLGDAGIIPLPNVIYNWNSPDIPAFTASTPAAIVDLPGTYALEVSNTLTGCSSMDTVLVTYDTLTPIADAGPDQLLSCNDPFVILNGGGSSSGNEFQFLWSSKDGTDCLDGADAVNPIVNCPGIYYLEITNRNTGCTALDSVQVNSDGDIPVVTPFPDTVLTCDQGSIELLADLTDAGDYTFNWCTLDDAGQIIPASCVDALTMPVDTAGRYQFTATSNSTGCAFSFITMVEDSRDLPQIDVGPDLTFGCAVDSLVIKAAAGPDLDLLDIAWRSVSNLPISDASTLNPVVYAADTLVMTVTNRETGCAVQDTLVIDQDINAPLVEAGIDTALTCLQTTLRLQGNGTANAGGSLSFQWTTSDGNIQADANTPNPLINRPGTYLLTVTDEQNGCTGTDAVVVVDKQTSPTAAIADLASLQFSCEVDTLDLDASGSMTADGGPLDYQWTVVSTGNLIGATDQPTIRTDAIGTYRLIVTDQGSGCRDSLQFTLSAAVGAPTIRIATPEDLSCNRDEILIDGTASEFGNNYTATWYDAAGNELSGTGLTLTVTQPGAYTLQIDNLQTGCSNLSSPVIVGLDTLAPTVSIAPTDLLDCTISSVLLDASASSAGPVFTYQWTTAGGILLNGEQQRTASAGGPGLYILEVNNIENGCSAIDSIEVEAITAPIAGLELNITAPGCDNDAGGSIVVAEVLGGTAPFVFQLNDGAERNDGIFSQLRAGTYTLHVRDLNGCEWSEEVSILEALPIDVDLGLDLAITSGDSVQLIAQTSTSDIVSYNWDPAVSTGPTAVVAPEVTTSYGITVTDSNGCSASDRVRLIVEKTRPYFAPNAFSPDGDGSNDQFMILTGPDVVNIPTFRIYDRWGHLVYERNNIPPNDPTLGWDGRHNGNLMNAAVFVYYIELEYNDGWVEAVQGDIALLR